MSIRRPTKLPMWFSSGVESSWRWTVGCIPAGGRWMEGLGRLETSTSGTLMP
jgi:hypothetical protein